MNTTHAPLGMQIRSAVEGEDRIPLDLFATAVGGWADLIRLITLEQSGSRPLVQWLVQQSSDDSSHLDLEPILVPQFETEVSDAEHVRQLVPQIVLEGLERVERGEDPAEVFSSVAAEHVRSLLRPLLSEQIAMILVHNTERDVMLTKQGAGRQHEISTGRRSIGSIEGELNAVSFSEQRPFFSLHQTRDSRIVKCYFDERQLLAPVLANLRERVIVSGQIQRADDGSPLSVTDVRQVRRLGGTHLPQPIDLVGLDPGLTDGLLSEDWLQRRRSG